MRTPSPAGLALFGAAVLAVTYGLARFVFGVFLPEIRDDLGLSAGMSGLVGAAPFVSFIAGVLIGPPGCRRFGPRLSGALALALAAGGLAAIAQAQGALVLALGAGLCGVSTGLSSPVMAEAAIRVAPPQIRGRVNAVHNAGTSLGVALAMPALTGLLGDWRAAYLAFGAVAAGFALLSLLYLPGPDPRADARPPGDVLSLLRTRWRAEARLSALAGGMGLVSGIYWVFAPDLVTRVGGLSTTATGWMWLAAGVVGVIGASAGDLIDRLGAARTHAAAMLVMAGALALIAAWPGSPPAALGSAAGFGAAYMTLTGFHLVLGVRLMEDRPALGPVAPLLATTVGQTAGSSASGWLIDGFGHAIAFGGFAGLGLLVAAASPLAPRGASSAPADLRRIKESRSSNSHYGGYASEREA